VDSLDELIGDSPAIVSLREEIRRFLRRQSGTGRHPPVLIQGETGTGKGLLAHALHHASRRARGSFVDVNCAAIPETLLEAELFGYERGAFTDARQAKPGLFRIAHEGTLFLDEVGLLAFPLQSKLLQVLEAGAVRPLGSTRSEPFSVWIMAATNEDLAVAVRGGRFRQDLYHRLAVMTLALPPLRARGDDVILLAERFLQRVSGEYGLPRKSLGDSARSALLAYPWPGNVRELSNLIERAVLLSDSAVITADMLEIAPDPPPGRRVGARASPPRRPDAGPADLLEVLTSTSWNVSRTAARLGISRNTVRARIRRFHLTPAMVEPGAAPPRPPGPALNGDELAPGLHQASAVASPIVQPVALRWERRRVALLRITLGTPAPSEATPLESSRWLEVLIDKVRNFGGQLEGVSPRGIEAVFGIERTEDPPRRAAHAALAVRRQLARRTGRTDPPPTRTAIHTCQALVVHAGGAGRIDEESKRQIAPVLDALMAAAAPGTIVVSGTAATFLRRRFTLQSGGQATPGLALYYLSGHDLFSMGPWSKGASLIGREQELALLHARLDSALAGQGQLVAVMGDPGVGKSRLIWEFTRTHRSQPIRILETGSAYGSITPHLSVTALLRRYFDIGADADALGIRERVDAGLSRVDGSLTLLLPAFLSLLDVPDREWDTLDPVDRLHRTRAAVTRLLVAESRIQPLVLVVEDVHWIDSASQAVLHALVEALPGVRLLLVVTHRPEYRHPWGESRCCTQLRLDPLSADSANELLSTLLGEDASLGPVKRRLVDWTGGNPLFLEESVQALVETGLLHGAPGEYRATGPLPAIDVPPTVEEVIAERIDRLAPEGKALIRSAAAIGAEAPLALLSMILNMPQDALQPGLEQLQTAELLYESDASREREVVFKHALTREVAYRSLLPEKRRDLHRRIVTAIEAAGSDRAAEHIDRLASHAFRGELWGKAVAYLREAGDRAARSAAVRQASEYFEQALEALGHQLDTRDVLEEGLDLRLRLCDVLWPQVRMPAILQRLREADRVAVSLEDRRRQGWIACYLCRYFWAVGELEQALEAGDRALAIARSLDSPALLVETSVYRGVAQFSLGAFRESAATLTASAPRLERAIAVAKAEFPSGRFVQNGQVILLAFLVRALAELGEFREALARGQEAMSLASTSGSPFAMAAASGGLGSVYVRRREPARAVQVLEPALQVCRTYRVNHWIPTVGGSLGAAYVGLGRIDEAVALLQECVDYGERLGLCASNSLWVIYLGEALLRAGRRGEALAMGDRALARCRERKERGYEGWACRLLGEISATGEAPDVDAATARYESALAVGRECAMRPLVAACHLGLGTLSARTGRRGDAESHLRAAAAEFRALEMPWPTGSAPDMPQEPGG
jgi:transcriptional regulator with AAA-type ATPase domain/tetratricopeptide (TPR) repeat protein